MAIDLNKLHSAITALIPTLLTTLEAFDYVQAKLHPPNFASLANFTQSFESDLTEAHHRFEALEFPEDIQHIKQILNQSCYHCLRACHHLNEHEQGFHVVMKAMRAICKAQETLYPLAPVLSPINQYFLEKDFRENKHLLTQLAAAKSTSAKHRVGILSANNSRDQRGGFSVYIPENIDLDKRTPVIIALHGGTGHGADFLWSWLRAARSRTCILVSPTSVGDTWSLNGDDADQQKLMAMLNYIKSSWPIEEDKILLTGMSDGATYTMLAGLQAQSPFTHLAPFSGVLHPALITSNQVQYARDKPIYLVHGVDDWMFPVEAAQLAEQQLLSAGAKLTYREIRDLSHTFSKAEIPGLMNWFIPQKSPA